MQLPTPLALLAASATAMPTTTGDSTPAAATLDKRGVITSIKLCTNDDCVSGFATLEVPEDRLSGCLPMPRAARSVMYLNHNGFYDCKVTTWSGRDYKGSSFTLEWADVGKCFNKVHGSITWDCTLKK